MIATRERRIEVREYEPCTLGGNELALEDGRVLWERWQQTERRVLVEFPSPATDGKWVITAQGWVGQIPIRPGLTLAVQPKVPVENLFGMLEVAYRLKSFRFLSGATGLETLEDFFEHLANLLAGRVLLRARRGFYREYVGRQGELSFVRGRMNMQRIARHPARVELPCNYRESTGDIEENQILAWTLERIARSGACTERSRPRVRRAYQAASGIALPAPVSAAACLDRIYNRLNEDYRTLHALCRFFLETTGPCTDSGGHQMLPFLVDMARLFELYVADWLSAELPDRLLLDPQHRHTLSTQGNVYWMMDLVLRDAATRAPLAVLDTKYKNSSHPRPADVAQVVAYAEALGCAHAYLVYPTADISAFCATVGSVRVRTIGFSLSGNLELGGKRLLHELLGDGF